MTSATLALGVALLAAGLDGEPLTAGGRNARVVDASRSAVFSLVWRRPLVRTGFDRTVGISFGAPAVSRRRALVVAGTGEGDVVARSSRDGRLAWRYRHGEPFESAVWMVDVPAAGQGEHLELAVLGCLDGSLLALDVASGRLVWRAQLDGHPRAPVRQVGDLVLVATAANRVFALNAASGEVRWSRGRTAPGSLTVHGHARPASDGQRVFATFSDGYAEAYALADGQLLWSRPLSVSRGEFVDADADPVVAGGRLFVASYSDGLYALDPTDGRTLWQRSAPAIVQLAEYRDLVLAGSADGYLFGVAQADGDLAYRTRFAAGPLSRLVVRDGLVALSGGVNGLVVLDAQSGKPLQASTFAEPFAGDLSWEGQELAFVGASGFLYALQLRDDVARQ